MSLFCSVFYSFPFQCFKLLTTGARVHLCRVRLIREAFVCLFLYLPHLPYFPRSWLGHVDTEYLMM